MYILFNIYSIYITYIHKYITLFFLLHILKCKIS